MEGCGNGEGLVLGQGCRDRCVQVHQLAMARQAGVAGPAGGEASSGQYGSDGVHHQLVFVAVLAGVQQGRRLIPRRGGAGQGITAQLAVSSWSSWRTASTTFFNSPASTLLRASATAKR
jgi:hypothetical protein